MFVPFQISLIHTSLTNSGSKLSLSNEVTIRQDFKSILKSPRYHLFLWYIASLQLSILRSLFFLVLRFLAQSFDWKYIFVKTVWDLCSTPEIISNGLEYCIVLHSSAKSHNIYLFKCSKFQTKVFIWGFAFLKQVSDYASLQ